MDNVEHLSEAKMQRQSEDLISRCSTVLTDGEVGVLVRIA